MAIGSKIVHINETFLTSFLNFLIAQQSMVICNGNIYSNVTKPTLINIAVINYNFANEFTEKLSSFDKMPLTLFGMK